MFAELLSSSTKRRVMRQNRSWSPRLGKMGPARDGWLIRQGGHQGVQRVGSGRLTRPRSRHAPEMGSQNSGSRISTCHGKHTSMREHVSGGVRRCCCCCCCCCAPAAAAGRTWQRVAPRCSASAVASAAWLMASARSSGRTCSACTRRTPSAAPEDPPVCSLWWRACVVRAQGQAGRAGPWRGNNTKSTSARTSSSRGPSSRRGSSLRGASTSNCSDEELRHATSLLSAAGAAMLARPF